MVLVDPNVLMHNTVAGAGSYPLIASISARPLLFAAILTPLVLFATRRSEKGIEINERRTLWFWFFGALFIQLLLRQLAPATLSSIIASNAANSYYDVSLHHEFLKLLRNYPTLMPSFPEHANSNMPGKILFYFFLKLFTGSKATMGVLIILLSNLGGLFTYFITKRLFDQEKRVALYAMVLYFFTPIKLYYFPLLNVISPILILFPFLMLLKYLEEKRKWCLAALGASVYFLLLFDPIPLVLGALFATYVLHAIWKRKLEVVELKPIVLVPVLSFLGLHLLFLFAFHFNALGMFFTVVKINSGFYLKHGFRKLWYLESLTSFFHNLGLATAILYLGYLFYLIPKSIARVWSAWNHEATQWVLKPAGFLAFFFFVNLMILNFSGLNRAEIPRYWIFMCPFVQIVVAYQCSKRLPRYSFGLVSTANLVQSTITLNTVGLLLP